MAIDRAAYGETSISFERFLDWWSAFPRGSQALFFGERILGALGLWPLSDAGAGALKAGRVKQAEVRGVKTVVQPRTGSTPTLGTC